MPNFSLLFIIMIVLKFFSGVLQVLLALEHFIVLRHQDLVLKFNQVSIVLQYVAWETYFLDMYMCFLTCALFVYHVIISLIIIFL